MKRTTKRFLAIFLTAMMLCSFIPAAAMAADEEERVYITVNGKLGDINDDHNTNYNVPVGEEVSFGLVKADGSPYHAADNVSWTMFNFNDGETNEDGNSIGQELSAPSHTFVTPGHYGLAAEWNNAVGHAWAEIFVGGEGSDGSTVMPRITINGADGQPVYDQRVAPGTVINEEAIRETAIAGTAPGDSPLGWMNNNNNQMVPFGTNFVAAGDVTYTLATASNSSNVENSTDANDNFVTGITNSNGSKLIYTQDKETNAIAEKSIMSSTDMALVAGTASAGKTVAQITVATQASPDGMAAFEQQLTQVMFEANASDLNRIAQANKSLRIVNDAGTWQIGSIALQTLYKAEQQTANGAVTTPDAPVQLIANKTANSGWQISALKVIGGEAKAVTSKEALTDISFTEAGPKIGTLQDNAFRGTIAVDSDVNDQNVATTVLRKDVEAELSYPYGGNAKSVKDTGHVVKLGVGLRF